MHEPEERLEYLIEKKPEMVLEILKKTYQENPKLIEHTLEQVKADGYIPSKKKYEELVERLKWANGNGRGAKWNFEDIKKNAKVNFDTTEYTAFDFAYLVNMLYAKCCKEFTDPAFYLKLAKCLLEDNDEDTKLYQGAYSKKHHHQKHGYQSYYNEYDKYDEEDRRRRHYMTNDYDEENRRRYAPYRNEEENRRSYNDDRENRYYKESNMGFNI